MRKFAFIRIAYILSFFLITGLFSSAECSAADNPEPQGNSSEVMLSKPIMLRYFCALPPDTAGVISDLSEVEVYKELEKRTNMKISFIHPPADVQLQFDDRCRKDKRSGHKAGRNFFILEAYWKTHLSKRVYGRTGA